MERGRFCQWHLGRIFVSSFPMAKSHAQHFCGTAIFFASQSSQNNIPRFRRPIETEVALRSQRGDAALQNMFCQYHAQHAHGSPKLAQAKPAAALETVFSGYLVQSAMSPAFAARLTAVKSAGYMGGNRRSENSFLPSRVLKHRKVTPSLFAKSADREPHSESEPNSTLAAAA